MHIINVNLFKILVKLTLNYNHGLVKVRFLTPRRKGRKEKP
jgi:hypothetical protein